ncbi:hypothetical protein V6N13_043893 [Hibiscus sabdariffa]
MKKGQIGYEFITVFNIKVRRNLSFILALGVGSEPGSLIFADVVAVKFQKILEFQDLREDVRGRFGVSTVVRSHWLAMKNEGVHQRKRVKGRWALSSPGFWFYFPSPSLSADSCDCTRDIDFIWSSYYYPLSGLKSNHIEIWMDLFRLLLVMAVLLVPHKKSLQSMHACKALELLSFSRANIQIFRDGVPFTFIFTAQFSIHGNDRVKPLIAISFLGFRREKKRDLCSSSLDFC